MITESEASGHSRLGLRRSQVKTRGAELTSPSPYLYKVAVTPNTTKSCLAPKITVFFFSFASLPKPLLGEDVYTHVSCIFTAALCHPLKQALCESFLICRVFRKKKTEWWGGQVKCLGDKSRCVFTAN